MKSMFRYPGSKAKLLAIIMEHLDPLLKKDNHFIDLFVGGGSVLLDVAERYPKHLLYANDKDYWMYCFWKIVSGEDLNNFNKLLILMEAKPTLDLFHELRNLKTEDEVVSAYKAIFFNRTCFSGILSAGPIGGESQSSKYTIDCRYNANKLQKKILECRKLLVGRTKITNNDFSEYQELIQTNHTLYADPPYFVKGSMLYPEKMVDEDHEKLSSILLGRQNWVLSYDDCPKINNLYKNCKIIDLAARYCIKGIKKNWENKNELLILPN